MLTQNFISTSHPHQQAIEDWEKQLAATADTWQKAKIYERLGAAYYHLGRLSEAIERWEKAAEIYRDKTGLQAKHHLAKTVLDQAQAYIALGQYGRAIERGRWAIAMQPNLPPEVAAIAWGTIANARAKLGELDAALADYDKSYRYARQDRNIEYAMTIANNQVGVLLDRATRWDERSQLAEAEGEEEEAAAMKQQAERDRTNAAGKAAEAFALGRDLASFATAEASINMMRIDRSKDREYREKATEVLDRLPSSRSKARAWIELAQFGTSQQQLDALSSALTVARNLGDRRLESLAVGQMGNWYERKGKLTQAMMYTHLAQFAAQAASAPDSLYRWQWQAGRMYVAIGDRRAAITAYSQAISTLSQLRGDLIAAERDKQFSFRDEVEPVYRQLLGLLLRSKESSDLETALRVADSLKISELQNFFGDECLELERSTRPVVPQEATRAAATVTSLLADRPYTILRLPDGRLKSYAIDTSVWELIATVKRLRLRLENVATREYLPVARELYDLLIRPLEKDLNAVKPDKLIFINDGILRTVPMSALHDGKQFLIEKYSVAYSLGLQTVRNNRLDDRGALIFGLSEAVPPLGALPNVVRETQFLQEALGGKKFLNRAFVAETLATQVASDHTHSILHLATHGEFSGAAGNSFVQAFDRRIYLPQLEAILRSARQTIQLLTLSACQTAVGDNRAILGLAGLAARTGVENVIASLWFVDDSDIVPIVENFYTFLKTTASVDEALRQSQLISIRNGVHPIAWSALVAVKS